MMSTRIVILIIFIALIMDRCDSSTSVDAVDSLTIAVRFEHSKALENLEHLHSFVRAMLMGWSDREIERASMIGFGGGADSSPSGMVVRDLRDDDVEIEKKEKLVAEFGRKLAAIKNTGLRRRSPECVEDGCYYKAANVCVVAYKNRDQCPTNNTCPKKKCKEKCADAKQWSKEKCPKRLRRDKKDCYMVCVFEDSTRRRCVPRSLGPCIYGNSDHGACWVDHCNRTCNGFFKASNETCGSRCGTVRVDKAHSLTAAQRQTLANCETTEEISCPCNHTSSIAQDTTTSSSCGTVRFVTSLLLAAAAAAIMTTKSLSAPKTILEHRDMPPASDGDEKASTKSAGSRSGMIPQSLLYKSVIGGCDASGGGGGEYAKVSETVATWKSSRIVKLRRKSEELIVNARVESALVPPMSGTQQRDSAREKAEKKMKGKAKPTAEQEANKGMTMEQRKARDAEIMRQKRLAKQGGEGGEGAGTPTYHDDGYRTNADDRSTANIDDQSNANRRHSSTTTIDEYDQQIEDRSIDAEERFEEREQRQSSFEDSIIEGPNESVAENGLGSR